MFFDKSGMLDLVDSGRQTEERDDIPLRSSVKASIFMTNLKKLFK
ncbi:hypothetical protein A45J_1812 [hot springs metagenome]|uniref:Uncharacterized protein n=1 Tax=hot springs metagenome TaxID=433727 RepID=A0A5J4KXS9_9ZZZZ